MAHAPDLLRYTSEHDKRKKILMYDNEFDPHLMPKHLSHIVSAYVVDNGLGTRWTDAGEKFRTDRPVDCRIFNVSEAIGTPPKELLKLTEKERQAEYREISAATHKAVAELKALGVNAFVRTHQGYADRKPGYKAIVTEQPAHKGYTDADFPDYGYGEISAPSGTVESNSGPLISQSLICLPFMKIKGEAKDCNFERDIKSAEILAAYLLKKGWLSEKDIAKEDVLHGQPVDCGAFGPSTLRAARSPEIQAIVEADTTHRSKQAERTSLTTKPVGR